MRNSTKVVGPSSGNLDAAVFFIGEAPGRLGADETGIPFHGDRAGLNFESLLKGADISRSQIYVTNTVLCNPKGPDGNNETPNREEVTNCSGFLTEQLAIVQPQIVVTVGAVALQAVKEIAPHSLTLKESVGVASPWDGRQIIPIYHPSQRAMVHRSYLNQQRDYRAIADAMHKLGVKKPKVYGRVGASVVDLVEYVIRSKGIVSYFALHKIVYLVEYAVHQEFGARFTTAYFIRQKDGPYCTDLHIKKLLNTFNKLKVRQQDGKLMLSWSDQGELLQEETQLQRSARRVDRFARAKADELLELDDARLKTRAYLTRPMRRIARKEKRLGKGAYNAPIEFE